VAASARAAAAAGLNLAAAASANLSAAASVAMLRQMTAQAQLSMPAGSCGMPCPLALLSAGLPKPPVLSAGLKF
jgi:hypothetical protein